MVPTVLSHSAKLGRVSQGINLCVFNEQVTYILIDRLKVMKLKRNGYSTRLEFYKFQKSIINKRKMEIKSKKGRRKRKLVNHYQRHTDTKLWL